MGRRRARIPRKIVGQGDPASELGYLVRGFDSRRLHIQKPSNLTRLLGFFFGLVTSCALSVPLWRLCPVRRGTGARAGRAAVVDARHRTAHAGLVAERLAHRARRQKNGEDAADDLLSGSEARAQLLHGEAVGPGLCERRDDVGTVRLNSLNHV